MSYSWVPFYKELAEKLLDYKNRRNELVEFIYAEDGLKEFSNALHLEDKTQKIDDIDPFSIFGLFNSGKKKNETRIAILERIKSFLNISADIPSDFDGIPVLNYARSFFYNWNNLHKSCDTLWDCFVDFIKNNSAEKYINYLNIKRRPAESTMPLFWIQPNEYIALDSNNREYLKKNGIDAENIENYDEYISFLDQLRKKIENNEIIDKSLMDLSYNAWSSEKDSKNYWLIAPGENARLWEEFYEKGIIGIGWDDLGDYSKYKKDKESFTKDFLNYYGEDRKRSATQVWRFYKDIKEGDIIFVKNGLYSIIGLGEVISGYYYDENRDEYNSLRDVEWVKKGNWDYPGQAPQDTVTLLKKDKAEEIINIMNYQDNTKQIPLMELLRKNKNLILHGAPGTGKTHLAKDIAAQIMLNKKYNELSDEEKESIKDQIGFVQFHPSYDYTDFVEGLRPVKDENGNVAFERMDGVFKKICSQVVKDKIKLQKTPQELIKEENTQEIVSKFLVESITDQRKFETVKNVSFYIKTYNKTHVIVMFETKDGTLKDAERIKYTDFINLYNSNKKIERSNIKDILGRKVERQADTYLCPIVNEMKKDQILPQLYEWKDTQTKFILKRGSDYEYEYFISEINEKYITIESSSTNGIKISSPTHRIDILDLLTTEETDSEDQYVRYYIEDLKNQLNKKEYFDSEEEKILGEKKYVFIIDEINRGELSKIFGELFYCIDPGYRGENGKISTQYQNLIEEDDPFYEGFYIPDNVYIIGTMNDIDRSVESMDFAFRRRFTFKEITAKDTQEAILSELDDETRKEAIKRMDSLNYKIWHKPEENESYENRSIEGLSSAYHIGGAYFLKLKDLDDDFEALWDYYLEGLLREYLRGMEDAEELLKKLHKAYNLKNQE